MKPGDIKKILTYLITEKGVSKRAIARAAGVAVGSVNNWLDGIVEPNMQSQTRIFEYISRYHPEIEGAGELLNLKDYKNVKSFPSQTGGLTIILTMPSSCDSPRIAHHDFPAIPRFQVAGKNAG